MVHGVGEAPVGSCKLRLFDHVITLALSSTPCLCVNLRGTGSSQGSPNKEAPRVTHEISADRQHCIDGHYTAPSQLCSYVRIFKGGLLCYSAGEQ